MFKNFKIEINIKLNLFFLIYNNNFKYESITTNDYNL